jgi:predicted phosphodiesterase
MATTVDDPLVIETVSRLLDMRFKLNLVTFVLHSKKAESGLNKITEVLVGRKMKAERLMADEKLLQEGVIDIDRGVLPEEKLLVLGDIHGCLLALQELKKRMTEEFKSDSTFPKRKIVFIGDVPDRGTYSALTVLYAANLVKSGAAEWIMGNHDVNMRNGLQLVRDTFKQSGKEWETWLKEDFNEEMLRPVVRSKATRRTILDLLKFIDIVDKGTLKKTRERARLRPRSLDALLDVLQTAPVYKEWRHLVAVHASLPRIPVAGEVLDANTEKKMTHGVKTYLGGVQDTLKIRTVVAKDPDRIVVAGHTHDPEVAVDVRSGTVGLDHSGEKIYGLKYPEMELISADEPYILEMITLAKSPELPTGQKLWELIRFLESQIMVKTNQGPKGSDYEGLTVVSYDEMTEVKSLWDHYPVLRNFRGVIIDNEGNIVARPFKKTHKAGVELPLETLDIVPEKIYEKANGSLGVCYFWKGEWRMATKFSLYNEGYTVPAKRMLDKMNTAVLDPKRTYLFEIILPTDPHIVDYEGREELVLLNANNTQTGEDLSWQEVEDLAGKLGCRTAEDMTTRFSGMTIAQIYKHAQTEGSLNNYEGLMAIYKDERTGESVTVKVKAVEYDNKKYVRDHLDWERMLDRLDWETLDMSDDDIEGFLSYKRDSQFVRAALEARINWVREEYDRIEQIFATEYKPYMDLALEKLQLLIQTDKNKKAVVDKTIREILSVMQSNGKGDEPGPVLDWIRCNLLGQPDRLRVYIESVIRKRIEKESKKRGHAAYWLLPE